VTRAHYQPNQRDLLFNLLEFLPAAGADFDAGTIRDLVDEVTRLATGPLAGAYQSADRNPPRFDPAGHTVTVGPDLQQAYQAWMDGEFWRLDLPEALGGSPAPRTLWWALAELVLGANAPVWMYATGPLFARILHTEGTPAQQRWAKLAVDRRWGATMVLTEPDAGSDVGAGRTRAMAQPDGTWHIEGVKRFITGGDHDLAGNILHYVLARPEGAGPGTKGLSLFIVPKHHFDPETGEPGARNGAFVTGVENKMGLHGSATCEITFGAHGTPAVGHLLGDVHDGIRQMFLVIENARMMVGTKAMATLSTGHLHALTYARTRVQGADLVAPGAAAARVTIDRHPDVRRSLMLQKAYSEGLRALVLWTAHWHDRALAGDTVAGRVHDLLLPIVKGFGSERAYDLLGSEVLQTFGGSGYLTDYPIEQYVRDAKIDTLYEGTTAIQALDLFFRKIVKDGGTGLGALAAELQAFVTVPVAGGARDALGRALGEVQRMLTVMGGWLADTQAGDPAAVYKVGLHSRRFLLACGDLLTAWLLQQQADVARSALTAGDNSPADITFYRGKIAAAEFFAVEVLPRLGADRRTVEAETGAIMDSDLL
jgi:alkylation response protein AidB-like acyl-CoA dehydrogenase